jgi:DNA-binding transcriptional ArsR family regulator
MPTALDRMAALADPTRRLIFELLAAGAPLSVGELAADLPVTRPAVSQHLRVLANAGLVTHRVEGTRHLYRIDLRGVAAMREYLDNLWTKALAEFKTTAEQTAPTSKGKR